MNMPPESSTPPTPGRGSRLFGALEGVRRRFQPGVNAMLDRLSMAEKADERQSFAADSDYAILQQ